MDWWTFLWHGLLHLPRLYRHTLRVSRHSVADDSPLWRDPEPACSDCVGDRRRHCEHRLVDRADILGDYDSSGDLSLRVLRARLQEVLLQIRAVQVVRVGLLRLGRKATRDNQERRS